MHQVLEHPDRHAREVGEPVLQTRVAGGGPQVAHLERLELERLFRGEVVLADQIRDAGEELLVLEHEQLGVEDARLVHAGAVLGLGPQVQQVALHVAHRGAQPPYFLLHPGARHHAVRHLGHGPAHHDRRSDGDPGGHPDALEQAVAHGRSSSSRSSASRISASRTAAVRCISWNPSATRASSAAIACSASSPSVLMTSDDPHSAASIMTPMMLFPFTVRSSFLTSTAHLKRLASLTNSAAGRACMPSGLTIFASRSITAIATPPGWPGRAAPRATSPRIRRSGTAPRAAARPPRRTPWPAPRPPSPAAAVAGAVPRPRARRASTPPAAPTSAARRDRR